MNTTIQLIFHDSQDEGGMAQAAPVSSAIVGPGGIALSIPSSTALAGKGGIALSAPTSSSQGGAGSIVISGKYPKNIFFVK